MILELNLNDEIEVSKIKRFLADNSDSDYMQSVEWNIIRNEKTKYFYNRFEIPAWGYLILISQLSRLSMMANDSTRIPALRK